MANRIHTGTFVALAALSLLGHPAAASPQVAQDEPATRPWSLGVWLGGGYQWSTGRLANNAASDNPNLQLLETVSTLGASPAFAGGVEVNLAHLEMSVRLGVEATRGAEVTGQVAICDLVEGRICTPQVAPAGVRSYMSSVRMLAGNPLRPVRPVFIGGFGIRSFEYDVPDCPPRTAEDESLICWAVTDLFRDPGTHYVIRAGVGVQAGTGPIKLGVEALGNTGRYRGGTGRTDGNWYHSGRLQVSTSVAVY